MSGGATIVVGERSLCVVEALLAAGGRAGEPQLRAKDGASGATGRNSKARERFDHSGEQRGHMSGGSHPRAHYNVEQATRRKDSFTTLSPPERAQNCLEKG